MSESVSATEIQQKLRSGLQDAVGSLEDLLKCKRSCSEPNSTNEEVFSEAFGANFRKTATAFLAIKKRNRVSCRY